MNKVVFDTNSFVSAFILPNSISRKAFENAIISSKIYTSKICFDEFIEVFLRTKFEKYLSLEKRKDTIGWLENFLVFIEVKESITDCRDPKDNKFLELAVAANANCLITGDNDLLVLHPFRNIPILNASDFLDQY